MSLKSVLMVISLAIVFFCIVVLTKCGGCGQKEKKASNITATIIDHNQKILVELTKQVKVDQVAHAVTSVATGNRKELSVTHKAVIKKVAKSAGIKEKQIDNSFSAKVEASGLVGGDLRKVNPEEVPLYQSETIEMPALMYEATITGDSFLHGTAVIDSNFTHVYLQYYANLKIRGTMYWERPHKFWFIKWGRPIFKQDLSTDCKNVFIDSIQAIKVVKGFR